MFKIENLSLFLIQNESLGQQQTTRLRVAEGQKLGGRPGLSGLLPITPAKGFGNCRG